MRRVRPGRTPRDRCHSHHIHLCQHLCQASNHSMPGCDTIPYPTPRTLFEPSTALSVTLPPSITTHRNFPVAPAARRDGPVTGRRPERQRSAGRMSTSHPVAVPPHTRHLS